MAALSPRPGSGDSPGASSRRGHRALTVEVPRAAADTSIEYAELLAAQLPADLHGTRHTARLAALISADKTAAGWRPLKEPQTDTRYRQPGAVRDFDQQCLTYLYETILSDPPAFVTLRSWPER